MASPSSASRGPSPHKKAPALDVRAKSAIFKPRGLKTETSTRPRNSFNPSMSKLPRKMARGLNYGKSRKRYC
jgi:hypothetical protein